MRRKDKKRMRRRKKKRKRREIRAKCYSGKTENVGMYDAMFIVGLRLPLMKLHCQLANYLGLFVS